MDDSLGMDDLWVMEDKTSMSDRGAAIIATTTVFLFLALATTAARFYSVYLSSARFKVEDWLILLGLCFTIATIGMSHALVIKGGVGHHALDVSPHQLLWSLRLFVPTAIIWAVAVCLIKLSVLVFFVGVFSMPKVKYAVWVVIVLTSTIFIGVILQSTLLCQPFEYTWNKAIEGSCGDERAGYMSIAIVELCNELAIVILPMPVVWQLQMPVKRKIAVSVVMGLGLIICAITAARIHAVTTIKDEDFTYTVVQDVIFAALELELSIIVANLPLMRALMRKLFGTSGTFGVVWKRSSKELSEPSSISSEKSLSARDRYYGKHSSSSSFSGSSPHKSLHGSMSSAPGAPPMRVLSTDRIPGANDMPSADTLEHDEVPDLESNYFPPYNHQHVPDERPVHSSPSKSGPPPVQYNRNGQHVHAAQPHSSFYATRYSQNANLQSPQHVHHAQGRDVAM